MNKDQFVKVITQVERDEYEQRTWDGVRTPVNKGYPGEYYLHHLAEQKYNRMYISSRFDDLLTPRSISLTKKQKALLCKP